MKENKLLSCPCCKSTKILKGESYLMAGKYWIGCDDCPCCMYGDRMCDLEKAWNTRTLVPIEQEAVEVVINESNFSIRNMDEVEDISKAITQRFGTPKHITEYCKIEGCPCNGEAILNHEEPLINEGWDSDSRAKLQSIIAEELEKEIPFERKGDYAYNIMKAITKTFIRSETKVLEDKNEKV